MANTRAKKAVKLRDEIRNEMDLGYMDLQFYNELNGVFESLLDLIGRIEEERYKLTDGEWFMLSFINCENNVSINNIINGFPKITDNPWDHIDAVTKVLRCLMDKKIIYRSYNQHSKTYIYMIDHDFYDGYQSHTKRSLMRGDI